tara:strand:+ start:1013 stop:1435 length:423 start_codon:yes stop_codon:yes gene_type:complete
MRELIKVKFDHIGIFVREIKYGRMELANLIDIFEESEIYDDPLLNVSVQFCYDKSKICYELVAPYGDNNPVDGVLKDNGNILNHVAYKTNKFDEKILQYREKGCIPLGPACQAVAFGGARVIFFLSPLKFIIELIEEINE